MCICHIRRPPNGPKPTRFSSMFCIIARPTCGIRGASIRSQTESCGSTRGSEATPVKMSSDMSGPSHDIQTTRCIYILYNFSTILLFIDQNLTVQIKLMTERKSLIDGHILNEGVNRQTFQKVRSTNRGGSLRYGKSVDILKLKFIHFHFCYPIQRHYSPECLRNVRYNISNNFGLIRKLFFGVTRWQGVCQWRF